MHDRPTSATEPNVGLAARLLQDHLQAKVDRGEKQVWVSPEAKLVLRTFYKAKISPRPQPAAHVAVPTEKCSSPVPAHAAAPVPRKPSMLTLEEKISRLAAVRERAENCQRARELGTLRDVMVFAVGNPAARILFVGEAPGAEEEAQREPFVGPAGQKLNQIIQAMGFTREDVYISNICKFRPRMGNQLTDNRKPTPEEMEACLEFVTEEIDIIRPEVVVALGGTAAEGLLGLKEPVGRMRHKFHDYSGIPAMVTYHPSYLLRNTAMSEKRKVWEDMLMVMELLGMPISEKQRKFFTSPR